MSKKPTYEELEQRVKEFEQEHGKLKQAEKRLLQESTMRDVLLDNLPCVALILKKETREIVASNKAAKQIGAVPGKKCYETCAQRDDHCPFCLAPKLWATGDPQHLEVKYEGIYYEGIWVPLTEELYVHYILDILAENVNDGILIAIDDGAHVFANKRASEITGYTPLELLSTTIKDLAHPDEFDWIVERYKRIISGKSFQTQYETMLINKDGKVVPIEVSSAKTVWQENPADIVSIRDITERKQMEISLQEAHDELEQRVEERTRELSLKTKSLEELNTAMKILLKKREEDKTEVEQSVMTNVRELIEPYFDKINETKLDDHQKAFLNILESNLNEIVSPFTRKLSLKYLNLTPREIQIVNMIKIGYQSKKIAKIMNVSPRTIDTHRKNIRSKIGLGQKRANLRSHILAHEQ